MVDSMKLRCPRFAWRMHDTGPVAGIVALILVLLLLIPPHGILSDNEENYFALAEKFVSPSAWPQNSAVFDASWHLTLSNITLGSLISAIGYTPTQVVTRLLTVAGYAVTLSALFRVFGLPALDAALAVMGTELIGQDIVGGEWLFGGYEAKVAAYLLVLAAVRLVLISERMTAAMLVFVVATYVHFLVGGFWFVAAMALRALDRPRDLRPVAAATGLYSLLIAPLIGVIAWSRYTDGNAERTGDVPAPDVIYSIIREPHHQSPFLSWAYFSDRWLPGYLMALAMLVACVWIARRGEGRQLRVVALWLAGLLSYLFLILGPKFLDRNSGMLGKFYLFRPSALILLLWLMLALGAAAAALGNRARVLRGSLLVLIGPAFLYAQGERLARDIVASEALEQQKRSMVAEVARVVAPGDVVLIDPDVEMQWLDFERVTRRPTLVTWKFTPTNDRELIMWYRRVEMRRVTFEQGCGPDVLAANVAYLLTTPAKSPRLAASCGAETWRAGRWVLLRLEAVHPASSFDR